MVDIVELPPDHQTKIEAEQDTQNKDGDKQDTPEIEQPQHQRLKLYLATPCYGCQMTVPFLASVMGLHSLCTREGVELTVDFVGNESLVERARNILAARFLASDATHLLFIDADIGFLPSTVLRLLRADKDVMTGVYSKKAYNWENVKAKLAAGDTEAVHQMGLDFNINIANLSEPISKEGFVRVLDSATGFMMIKRAVLERMAETYRAELFCVNDIMGQSVKEYVALFACLIDPQSKRFLSEDYSFCRRYQQLGGDIWADLASPLAHIGTQVFSGDIRYRLSVSNDTVESTATPDTAITSDTQEASTSQGGDHEQPGQALDDSTNAGKGAQKEAQDEADDALKVAILVVVGSGRKDANLVCATSLLKLQTALMVAPEKIRAHMDFVATLDDALNVLHACKDQVVGGVVVRADVGFDPEFVLRCMRASARGDFARDHGTFIVGSYPLATVDWEAVKAKGSAASCKEPAGFWGNVYNAEPVEGPPSAAGYIRAAAVKDLGLAWLDTGVLAGIARRHPDIVSADGSRAAFATPGVFGGKVQSAEQRFLSLHDGEMWIDVHALAVGTGAVEFTGCVGARQVLR